MGPALFSTGDAAIAKQQRIASALQWGRRYLAPETDAAPLGNAALDDASMGPALFSTGDASGGSVEEFRAHILLQWGRRYLAPETARDINRWQ